MERELHLHAPACRHVQTVGLRRGALVTVMFASQGRGISAESLSWPQQHAARASPGEKPSG